MCAYKFNLNLNLPHHTHLIYVLSHVMFDKGKHVVTSYKTYVSYWSTPGPKHLQEAHTSICTVVVKSDMDTCVRHVTV